MSRTEGIGASGSGYVVGAEGATNLYGSERLRGQLAAIEGVIDNGLGALSDEDILLMVGQSSREMDMQIQSKLSGMRQRLAETDALREANNALMAQAGTNAETTQFRDVPVTYTNEQGNRVTEPLSAILGRAGVELPPPGAARNMTPAFLDRLKSAIQSRMESIRSQGEMGQIELQQLMSRRGQLLQVTSNIMASRNETRKGIAQNIRG